MKLPAILKGKPQFSKDNPLRLNHPKIYEKKIILKNIMKILDSGNLTDDKYVRKLEKKVEEKLKVRNAIAVSNCTIGLIIALKALEIKGEVLVPSFTFMATLNAILWNNLKPRFVEIDPATLTVDPHSVIKNISSSSSCLMTVTTFGNIGYINSLNSIAKEYGLRLISDSAHALGASFGDCKAGSLAEVEVFSLSPTKPIVAGEGGIITTNNDYLAGKIRILKNYGHEGDYNAKINGLNARLAEINALIALLNFSHLEEEIERRNQLATKYKKMLSSIPGIRFPSVLPGVIPTYKDFAIILEKGFPLSRDLLQTCLRAENIETRTYFDPPCHLQRAFKSFNKQNLPITEKISKSILILPFFSKIKESEMIKVVEAIKTAFNYADEIKNCVRNG